MNSTLTVSRTTAGFIERGHPWVRPDRFTRGLERLRDGEAVTLIDERGKPLASALAEPGAEICARVFHRKPGMAFDPAAALARVWERRAALHADPATDCYRVVHGEADFLPGLRIERYGAVLVVVVLAGCIIPHLDPLCQALAALQPGSQIVIKDHRDDLRRKDVAVRRWGGGAVDPEQVVVVRELGVALEARPCAGLATGVYVDQRTTRAWLRPQAAGRRVLNLFAYTGAFSASLLAAGAAAATDVDLAAPSLAVAAANARLNGVAERHRSVHEDCRRFLAAPGDGFDVVIVDPPTAAQGGDAWVLRRDYPGLLRLAWTRVAPGGLLVACCNTLHGKPFPLEETVAALGGAVVETPGPADDIPPMRGFPEGRPWRLAAARKTAG
ncbi:MAG: class I SAM-dependent methyltransferase [Planctomycetes bacterium]|nr:class I SAM-dependent methyltransferase [Planctomycetota bacterium]